MFFGNPWATITAIDTSGGIVSSRDGETVGGVITIDTPGFIQVSAHAITSINTSRPFEDLEFRWNFGDPTGTERFDSPFTGLKDVNQNWQYGPIAEYVYRAAGDYTITLDVRGVKTRDVNGNPTSYTTATVTLDVHVDAFTAANDIWYFDQNATGANDGTTAADAFTLMSGGVADMTNLQQKLDLGDVDIRIACGSDWSTTLSTPRMVTISKSNTRISSYIPASGETAKPRFYAISTSDANRDCFRIAASTSLDNIVISGLQLEGDGLLYIFRGLQATAEGNTWTNIYLDKLDLTGNTFDAGGGAVLYMFPTVFAKSGGLSMTGVGYWGCNIISTLTQAQIDGGEPRPAFIDTYGAMTWMFRHGCVIRGIAGTDVRHHILNNETNYKLQAIKFCTVSGSSGGNCLNGNARGFDSGKSPYHYYGENDFSTGGNTFSGCFDLSNSQGDVGDIQDVEGVSVSGPVNGLWTVTVTGDVPSTWAANTPVDFFGFTPSTFDRSVLLASADVEGRQVSYTMPADPGTYVSGGHYSTGRGRYAVIERNRVHDIPGPVTTFGGCEEITLRNNLAYSNINPLWIDPSPILKDVFACRSYGNKIHVPSDAGVTAVYNFPSGPGWTQAQMVRGDIVFDERDGTGGDRIWNAAVKELADNVNTDIGGNTYWYPSYASQNPFLTQAEAGGPGSGSQTFGTWSAFVDADSTVGDPGFIQPAEGVFDQPANRVTFGMRHAT